MLKKYLQKDYSFHINHNSAELIRNLKENVLWVFSQILHPLLTLITELLVMLFVIIVLLIAEPMLTIFALIMFSILGYMFFYKIKNKTKELGVVQQDNLQFMNLWVYQGLGGVKETKLHSKEKYFVEHYSSHAKQYAEANTYMKTVSILPRPFFEIIIMSFLSISVIVILNSEKNFNDYSA